MNSATVQEPSSVERRSLLRAHVPRTLLETMAHGGGWIAGLVKAVPSGDTVLVMGNTGQVRADPAIGATSGIVKPPVFVPAA